MPKTAASGIAAIHGELFDSHQTADYIGRSLIWVNNQRFKDRRRIERGQEPLGPRYIKDRSGRVRYPRHWLDEYLTETYTEPYPAA